MPASYLDLENTVGNLLLETEGSLLLETSADYEMWQLYDLDEVEREFKDIIQSAVGSNVQVLMKRETATEATPRVNLTLITQANQSQKYLINPGNDKSQFQAWTTWFYQFSAEVETNRETNGSQHAELVGKVRGQLQMYALEQSWGAPLHTIIDIMEQPEEVSFDNEANVDSTKMNFTGMLCIRNGAWSLVS